MKLEQLKYIIQTQRYQLSQMYEWKTLMKDAKKQYDVEGTVHPSHLCHEEYGSAHRKTVRRQSQYNP